MSNNLPAPLGEGMLTVWVDALKAIPGAAKAIAHLVSGAADAGNAWVDVIKARGERQAQQIRDETNSLTGRLPICRRRSQGSSKRAKKLHFWQ